MERLRFTVEGGVAHVTLDTGDGINAIDQQLAVELAEVAAQCYERADVRAILLDGAGANFCCGGDVRAFAGELDHLPEALLDRTMYFHQAISLLSNAPAPVLMAVHGNVIGGGIAFLTVADIVIAAAGTTFRSGYTALGLTPDGGATYALPRLVGVRRALDLTLTNRPFGASEAEAWGLVSRVVADDELQTEAAALAERLARGPTQAFAATRRLMRESATATLESQLAAEARAIALAAKTSDGLEGIAAFIEKRKPNFKGPRSRMPDDRNQLTVGFMPHFHAQHRSRVDEVAVTCDGFSLTWGELSTRVAKLANRLKASGVKHGDHVAAFMRNRAEYVEIIYALAGLGAAIVPVGFRLVGRELHYSLENADVVRVFVGADLLPTFESIQDRLPHLTDDRVIVVGSDGDHAYEDYEPYLAAGSDALDYIDADENDVFWLAFTGGTTGPSKLCEVSHRACAQMWMAMTMEFGILEHDVSMIAGPFYHGLGFFFGLQQLMVGGRLVILPDFDAERVLREIEQERVTWVAMAPSMYTMVLAVEDRERFDVTSMRGLVSSAAPLMTTTKHALLDHFTAARLYEYYGAMEGGFYSVLKPRDQLRKTRCVGEAFYNNELCIMDAEGRRLPPGEVGLIYKRGLRLTTRYYKNPAATEALFAGDWHTNSDMGYMDEDGYLYIVDRRNDMIISGGVNIFSSEIEEVISWHPAVLEVAVIGVPDEKWGQSVKAYVVARTGAELDAEQIVEHCKRELASYKKPRFVEFLPELPRNAAGKLLKYELRTREGSPAQAAG